MKVFPVLFSLTFVLLAGCNLFSNEGQDDERSEYEAKIIFGKSIDGVEIGDDTTTVIRKLGKPSSVAIPDYPGVIYFYREDNYEFLEVFISYILPHGVMNLSISYPYNGKTTDGVGIGTSLSESLNVLGPPDASYTKSGALVDSYFFKDNIFRVEYYENKLFSILMDRRNLNRL